MSSGVDEVAALKCSGEVVKSTSNGVPRSACSSLLRADDAEQHEQLELLERDVRPPEHARGGVHGVVQLPESAEHLREGAPGTQGLATLRCV